MNKNLFNIMGFILLIGMTGLWIGFGYSSWYLLLLLLAAICFAISDGSIKELKKIQQLSLSRFSFILITFILSVGIVFGLILLASYVINDMLHLTGWTKTSSQVIAIILALYPIKFVFGNVVYKVISGVKDESNNQEVL